MINRRKKKEKNGEITGNKTVIMKEKNIAIG